MTLHTHTYINYVDTVSTLCKFVKKTTILRHMTSLDGKLRYLTIFSPRKTTGKFLTSAKSENKW